MWWRLFRRARAVRLARVSRTACTRVCAGYCWPPSEHVLPRMAKALSGLVPREGSPTCAHLRRLRRCRVARFTPAHTACQRHKDGAARVDPRPWCRLMSRGSGCGRRRQVVVTCICGATRACSKGGAVHAPQRAFVSRLRIAAAAALDAPAVRGGASARAGLCAPACHRHVIVGCVRTLPLRLQPPGARMAPDGGCGCGIPSAERHAEARTASATVCRPCLTSAWRLFDADRKLAGDGGCAIETGAAAAMDRMASPHAAAPRKHPFARPSSVCLVRYRRGFAAVGSARIKTDNKYGPTHTRTHVCRRGMNDYRPRGPTLPGRRRLTELGLPLNSVSPSSLSAASPAAVEPTLA